ncbi:MAG: imelysin family protein [Endozoicomonas sp.]
MAQFPKVRLIVGLFLTSLLAACSDNSSEVTKSTVPASGISEEQGTAVVEHYTNVAYATFEDALITARQLRASVGSLVSNPSEENLKKARQVWKEARVPYMQTEVFRFGNAVVDDWEGQLNAWPLDEGLIDYVDASGYDYEMGNEGATANIIASQSLQMGDEVLDLNTLTPELLASLNELAGSEANVATGYHAIEFLLWGQDLNGTNAGAGDRPATDFAAGEKCTNGNCKRRAEYLLTVTDLLVSDLEFMENQWKSGVAGNYRAELLQEPVDQGLRKMLFGMGSLALGELAGERMKVALEANSSEDEHDCFSDNTHFSHFYNAQGIRNVFTGEYQRVDGSVVDGPSLADWLAEQNAEQFALTSLRFDGTRDALQTVVDSAEQQGVVFDQLIGADNQQGNALVQNAISSLVAQTEAIEQLAALAGIQQLNPDNAEHEF